MLPLPLPPQERIRNSYLRSEYERGGVPIFEVNHREWKSQFYKRLSSSYENDHAFMGYYHNDPFCLQYGLPRQFIIVNRSLSNTWRLAVFYHELGHHACAKCRCPCARGGFQFRKTELHAELAAMYIATHRQFKIMVYNMMVDAISDLDHQRFDCMYNATRLIKHAVFLQAKELVGDMFTAWLDDKNNTHLKERYLNATVDESTRACRWEPSGLLRRFVGEIKA